MRFKASAPAHAPYPRPAGKKFKIEAGSAWNSRVWPARAIRKLSNEEIEVFWRKLAGHVLIRGSPTIPFTHMGSHPINLALRFILEIAGLAALGFLGWHYGKGIYRYVLALGLPFMAAAFWGTFAVLDDPSRSGNAIVQVSGIVRLLLEMTFFCSATWSLFSLGATNLGWFYGIAVLTHYVVSYDRILWLIDK